MTYPHQQYLAERPDGRTRDGMAGDCYRTCVAICVGVDPETLPHFVMHGENWWPVTRRTVRELEEGLDIQCYGPSPFPVFDATPANPRQRLAIASGPSPRGPFKHCIVIDAMTGDFVHDPHPSGAGLAGDIELIDVFVEAYEPEPPPPVALPPAPPTPLGRRVLLVETRTDLIPISPQIAADIRDLTAASVEQPPKENR